MEEHSTLELTRDTYREYPAISYSKLSALSQHPEKVVTEKDFNDGMMTGDILDMLMYDGEDAFHKKYFVSTLDKLPSDTVKAIIDFCNLDFTDENLIKVARAANYQARYGDQALLKALRKDNGQEYMNELTMAGSKPIISFTRFAELQQAAKTLLQHPFSRNHFGDNWQYQVPVEAEITTSVGEVVKVKGLLDGLNLSQQPIIINDLKWSSYPLRNFKYNFWKLNYHLQSALYSYIIQSIHQVDVVFKYVVYSGYERRPQVFKVPPEILEIGMNGGYVKGWYMKGVRELINELLWHQRNDKWDYPMNVYEYNGEETLQLPDFRHESA